MGRSRREPEGPQAEEGASEKEPWLWLSREVCCGGARRRGRQTGEQPMQVHKLRATMSHNPREPTRPVPHVNRAPGVGGHGGMGGAMAGLQGCRGEDTSYSEVSEENIGGWGIQANSQ